MVMMPYTSSTKPGLSRVYQKKIILYQLFRGCIIFFFLFLKQMWPKNLSLCPAYLAALYQLCSLYFPRVIQSLSSFSPRMFGSCSANCGAFPETNLSHKVTQGGNSE